MHEYVIFIQIQFQLISIVRMANARHLYVHVPKSMAVNFAINTFPTPSTEREVTDLR